VSPGWVCSARTRPPDQGGPAAARFSKADQTLYAESLEVCAPQGTKPLSDHIGALLESRSPASSVRRGASGPDSVSRNRPTPWSGGRPPFLLGELYGRRFQTLGTGRPARTPRLSAPRACRTCLGLGRKTSAPTSGIVLFERPDALIERADRARRTGELPFTS